MKKSLMFLFVIIDKGKDTHPDHNPPTSVVLRKLYEENDVLSKKDIKPEHIEINDDTGIEDTMAAIIEERPRPGRGRGGR